ncbi:MAG: ABC transporter permease [Acidimicrobiia bacterium]
MTPAWGRTSIAWRNLVREKTRLAISVGGVAIAVLLILTVRGLYAGFLDQATAYIRGVDADVWVVESGTPGDFFHSVSLQPPERAREIAAVDGVERVSPLVARPVVFRHRGDDVDLFLVGVDKSGVGGPVGIEEGERIPGRGELVVDRVFARNEGVDMGDILNVEGNRLRVTGIARGGNSIISQYGWASFDDVSRLLGAGEVVNYFLVEAGDGVDQDALARRIRDEVSGTKPLTEDEFADANTEDLSEGFLPILWVLVVIAFAIGTSVIALTIYTATLEKRREYGVLKAIGFSNRRLVGIVWRQSMAAGLAGLAVGVVATLGLAALLERLLPAFVVTIGPSEIVLVAVAALAMGVVASFVPVRPVTRLDPAQVFRV